MPTNAPARLTWAAKSEVPLSEACDRIRDRLGLAPFRLDSEVEGEDHWVYGTSANAAFDLNLTAVGECHDPAKWAWMWGVLDRANYQIVVTWAADAPGPDPDWLAGHLSEVLGCELIAYPEHG